MAKGFALNTEKQAPVSLIEWLTSGKVGDNGSWFHKIQEAPESTRIDEASATVTYIGYAEPGTTDATAKWRIKKIEKSGTVTSVTWADGNDFYDNVWNDRATSSFS